MVELLGTGRNYDPAQRPQSQVTSRQVKSCAKSSQVKSQVKSSQLMSVKSSELKTMVTIWRPSPSLFSGLFHFLNLQPPVRAIRTRRNWHGWIAPQTSKQAASKQANKQVLTCAYLLCKQASKQIAERRLNHGLKRGARGGPLDGAVPEAGAAQSGTSSRARRSRRREFETRNHISRERMGRGSAERGHGSCEEPRPRRALYVILAYSKVSSKSSHSARTYRLLLTACERSTRARSSCAC